jgi:hypothetical protein
MRRLIAGIMLGGTFFVPSLAHAQRHSRARRRLSRAVRESGQIPQPPLALSTNREADHHRVEVPRGERRVQQVHQLGCVSGDDPAGRHERDQILRIRFSTSTLGFSSGELPIWVQGGGYYRTGLETNTTLEDGETIHGKVDNYGAGADYGITPLSFVRAAIYLWAMGYYDRNDGDFDIINGAVHTENRVHTAWIGEYGIGAVYLIEEVVGINFGISYSGIFDKKNADESIRVKLGLLSQSSAGRHLLKHRSRVRRLIRTWRLRASRNGFAHL